MPLAAHLDLCCADASHQTLTSKCGTARTPHSARTLPPRSCTPQVWGRSGPRSTHLFPLFRGFRLLLARCLATGHLRASSADRHAPVSLWALRWLPHRRMLSVVGSHRRTRTAPLRCPVQAIAIIRSAALAKFTMLLDCRLAPANSKTPNGFISSSGYAVSSQPASQQ